MKYAARTKCFSTLNKLKSCKYISNVQVQAANQYDFELNQEVADVMDVFFDSKLLMFQLMALFPVIASELRKDELEVIELKNRPKFVNEFTKDLDWFNSDYYTPANMVSYDVEYEDLVLEYLRSNDLI